MTQIISSMTVNFYELSQIAIGLIMSFVIKPNLLKQTRLHFADAILSLDKSAILSIWLGDSKVD